jgi:hypothetical protein
MQILQTTSFKKAIKKLYLNQKQALDNAIRQIIENPTCGNDKKGNLVGIKVYKFHMLDQLTLLAYQYDEEQKTIVLLALRTHENFYRDLKHGL